MASVTFAARVSLAATAAATVTAIDGAAATAAPGTRRRPLASATTSGEPAAATSGVLLLSLSYSHRVFPLFSSADEGTSCPRAPEACFTVSPFLRRTTAVASDASAALLAGIPLPTFCASAAAPPREALPLKDSQYGVFAVAPGIAVRRKKVALSAIAAAVACVALKVCSLLLVVATPAAAPCGGPHPRALAAVASYSLQHTLVDAAAAAPAAASEFIRPVYVYARAVVSAAADAAVSFLHLRCPFSHAYVDIRPRTSAFLACAGTSRRRTCVGPAALHFPPLAACLSLLGFPPQYLAAGFLGSTPTSRLSVFTTCIATVSSLKTYLLVLGLSGPRLSTQLSALTCDVFFPSSSSFSAISSSLGHASFFQSAGGASLQKRPPTVFDQNIPKLCSAFCSVPCFHVSTFRCSDLYFSFLPPLTSLHVASNGRVFSPAPAWPRSSRESSAAPVPAAAASTPSFLPLTANSRALKAPCAATASVPSSPADTPAPPANVSAAGANKMWPSFTAAGVSISLGAPKLRKKALRARRFKTPRVPYEPRDPHFYQPLLPSYETVSSYVHRIHNIEASRSPSPPQAGRAADVASTSAETPTNSTGAKATTTPTQGKAGDTTAAAAVSTPATRVTGNSPSVILTEGSLPEVYVIKTADSSPSASNIASAKVSLAPSAASSPSSAHTSDRDVSRFSGTKSQPSCARLTAASPAEGRLLRVPCVDQKTRRTLWIDTHLTRRLSGTRSAVRDALVDLFLSHDAEEDIILDLGPPAAHADTVRAAENGDEKQQVNTGRASDHKVPTLSEEQTQPPATPFTAPQGPDMHREAAAGNLNGQPPNEQTPPPFAPGVATQTPKKKHVSSPLALHVSVERHGFDWSAISPLGYGKKRQQHAAAAGKTPRCIQTDTTWPAAKGSVEAQQSTAVAAADSPLVAQLRALSFAELQLYLTGEEVKLLLTRHIKVLLPQRLHNCRTAMAWLLQEKKWSTEAVKQLLLHVPQALSLDLSQVKKWFAQYEVLFGDSAHSHTLQWQRRSQRRVQSAAQQGGQHQQQRQQENDDHQDKNQKTREQGKKPQDEQPKRGVQEHRTEGDNLRQLREVQFTAKQLQELSKHIEQVALRVPMAFKVRKPLSKVTHFAKVWRSVRSTRCEYRPAALWSPSTTSGGTVDSSTFFDGSFPKYKAVVPDNSSSDSSTWERDTHLKEGGSTACSSSTGERQMTKDGERGNRYNSGHNSSSNVPHDWGAEAEGCSAVNMKQRDKGKRKNQTSCHIDNFSEGTGGVTRDPSCNMPSRKRCKETEAGEAARKVGSATNAGSAQDAEHDKGQPGECKYGGDVGHFTNAAGTREEQQTVRQKPSATSKEDEFYRGYYELMEAFAGNLDATPQQLQRLEAEAACIKRARKREEVALQQLFARYPKLLTMNIERNVRAKLLYLQNYMMKELDEVMVFPQYLSYSLRKRIIPRHIALVNAYLHQKKQHRRAANPLYSEGEDLAAVIKAARTRSNWDSRMQQKKKLLVQLKARQQRLRGQQQEHEKPVRTVAADSLSKAGETTSWPAISGDETEMLDEEKVHVCSMVQQRGDAKQPHQGQEHEERARLAAGEMEDGTMSSEEVMSKNYSNSCQVPCSGEPVEEAAVSVEDAKAPWAEVGKHLEHTRNEEHVTDTIDNVTAGAHMKGEEEQFNMYEAAFWERRTLLKEELLPVIDERKGWRGMQPYQPLSMPLLPPLRDIYAASDDRFMQRFNISYQDFVSAKVDAQAVKNPQALF